MTKSLISIISAAFFLSAHADSIQPVPTGWIITGNTGLTASLNYYSDNWTGKEQNSALWNWQLTSSATRQFTPLLLSTNTLKLAFGQTATQKDSVKEWSPMKKSNDLIDFESVLKFTLNSWVDPFISFQAISQFLDARSATYDMYGNPLQITEGFGVSRTIRQTKLLSLQTRLGGAFRQQFERNEFIQSTKMVDRITNDGGFEMVTELNATNKENWYTLTSKFLIYEALFSSTNVEPGMIEKWRWPDINWENTLTINLTKYIMLNVYAQLMYDKEIDDLARFKSVTGLGISVDFGNNLQLVP